MTLFSLTGKNIKRNFYNYFLYFISMIFIIVIFYTFSSIQHNQQVIDNVGTKFNILLQIGAISVSVFSAIFMWYSSSFFTRKRKKEIGLYSLLGLRKKEIGKMLFYENLVMGIVALGIGIILGSLFSKVFVMLFLRMMGYFIEVNLTVSLIAIKDTLIVFSIIFIIISIYSYRIIYRFKLVDLFTAESKGEKEPKASFIVAILSILMIGAGYYIALSLNIPNFLIYALVVVGLVCIGTYGLFRSFIVFILKLTKMNKNRYFKGLNMITISQMVYRIKSHATILATIAILCATTLTAVGTSYSFYYTINKDAEKGIPFSYIYLEDNQESDDIDEQVDNALLKYPKNKLIASVDVNYYELNMNIPDTTFESPDYDVSMSMISESTYDEIIKVLGIDKPFSLGSDEEVALVVPSYFYDPVDQFSNKQMIINQKDQAQHFDIVHANQETLIGFYLNYLVVVKDQVFDEMTHDQETYRLRALKVENEKSSAELTDELLQITDNRIYTFYQIYIEQMQFRGMIMFVGAFLGLVILLATGSIIYFKQLTEAASDERHYIILRNVGVGRKEIKKSIAKQMLAIFLYPLIVGTIHSCVALKVLSLLLMKDLTIATIITVSVYVVIYLIYYYITVKSYNKIVNAKQ